MNENEHVRTAIRWRPVEENDQSIIEKISNNVLNFCPQNQTFMFDHVIDGSNQNDVFDLLVKPLVDKAFEGYDCTFIATGQSGSGKTYTMGFENSVDPGNSGMTARVLNAIFSYQNVGQVKVAISFLEVYNERIYDLLGDNQQQPVKKDKQVCEETRKTVRTEDEVMNLLSRGTNKRHTRDNKMNVVSSRSHVVFTIFLGIERESGRIIESKINLVDLAGSEGFTKMSNKGEAHIEGKNINKSVSAFKRVISAMSTRAAHIPYRDSVITYTLRNSLKPECYLTLLGCVSAHQRDSGETLATLIFVSDAKKIKKTPQINAVISQFQQSKTPVKRLNSFVTPFKRPPLRISTTQNKSVTSRISSEPRRSYSLKPLNRKLPTSTTTKKPSMSSIQIPRRSSFIRPLFPTSISRKDIENRLQSSSMMHDSTITFHDVSTSSKFNSPMKLPQPQPSNADLIESVEKILEDLRKCVNKQAPTQTHALIDILREKINQQPSESMVSSFQANPIDIPGLSTLVENDCSDGLPTVTGMESKTQTEMEMDKSIVEVIKNDNCDESVGNVSIHVDHCEKIIVVEMPTINDVPLPQDVKLNLSQNLLQLSNLNTPLKNEPGQNDYVSSEEIVSSTTKPNKHERKSIGVLRLRRCSPKNEEIEEPINAVYEIIIGRRRTMEKSNESMEQDLSESPPDIGYPLEINNAIASKSSSTHFPLRPRIILQRINSIEEYYQSEFYNQNRTAPQVVAPKKATRKVQRTQSTLAKKTTKTPTPPSKTDLIQEVLNILNTGSEKDLQKLHMIGKKTANQIFVYRGYNGLFHCIDALLQMPFWTKKMHERFLANNILV